MAEKAIMVLSTFPTMPCARKICKALVENGLARLDFPPKWLEVPIDQDRFLKFMKSIDDLLSGPMPEESSECKWCQYRHAGETLAHINNKEDVVNF